MPEPKATRPNMPHYGIHSSPDGLMSWDWVDAQMTKSRNYWICSTRPDGRPHAAPVWGIWLDGVFYFGSHSESRKGRNLAANPAVVVHLESGDDTVIFEGTVEAVRDPALLRRIGEVYSVKYEMQMEFSPDDEQQVCYALRAQSAFSWLEKDYPRTATRWVLAS